MKLLRNEVFFEYEVKFAIMCGSTLHTQRVLHSGSYFILTLD